MLLLQTHTVLLSNNVKDIPRKVGTNKIAHSPMLKLDTRGLTASPGKRSSEEDMGNG